MTWKYCMLYPGAVLCVVCMTITANDVGHIKTKWCILDKSIYYSSNLVTLSISAKTVYPVIMSPLTVGSVVSVTITCLYICTITQSPSVFIILSIDIRNDK